jgi:hypothetical protein
MEDDLPENWTVTAALPIALGRELDAACEMSASHEGEKLFAQVAEHCPRGATLAEAALILIAQKV